MAFDGIAHSTMVRSAKGRSWRSIGVVRGSTRDRRPRLVRLSAIAAVMLIAGCGEPPGDGLSERPFAQDPRRAFELIVNHFKHQYTGGAIAVPTRIGREGERRNLLLRFIVEDVQYTVRGCERLSDPCTAEMTVRTSTHSSLQRSSPSSAEESSSSRDAGTRGTRHWGSDRMKGSATAGAEDEERRLSDTLAAESVLRRQNKSREQTCHFSYENGRWVLTSQLPDDSMKRAIEFALASQ